MPRYRHTPQVCVLLPCTLPPELLSERRVEVLNVAEDAEGRDRLTFRCPLCGATHTSLRFG